jgi:very-short-patch-repair endonuclease
MRRFVHADTVNDLFADSPLEDRLWEAFKAHGIPAERQWQEEVKGARYFLDFALFCRDGKIDVEADGDTYHITAEQAPRDNERNNELTSHGWSVLRFESARIRRHLTECVDKVLETVDSLKGFESTKLVPTRYIRTTAGVVPQLSLFDAPPNDDGPAI